MREAGFVLISLRPVGGHAPLRRVAARHGGRVLALSPWRIEAFADPSRRRALRDALAAKTVLFTSPAAVHAAAALQPLRAKRGQAVFGIGEGTRRALLRAGVHEAQAPARMDSEGLLALPAFMALSRGDAVGLVTAPGGRGEIARQLSARGVSVRRADVYARVAPPLAPASLRRLQCVLDEATSPLFLALSSGEAFTTVLAQLPPALAKSLRGVHVIAASDRLAQLARQHGFRRVRVAASARPADLLAALAAALL